MGFDHPALRDSIDYGPPREVRLCVYLDEGISRQDAEDLLHSWDEQASIYNLYLTPVSFEGLTREGFLHSQILAQVARMPLPAACDRMLYFVNRNAGDALYGLASIALGLPEVLGEVDDATLTRGYVVARRATMNQIVVTPAHATEHELFHLLGCPSHFNMPDCYRRIQGLKAEEAKLEQEGYYRKNGEPPFYPTFASAGDAMLVSHAEVNEYGDAAGSSVGAVAH